MRLTLSSLGRASGQAKNEHLGSAELRFVGVRVSEWKAANALNRSLKPAEQSKLRENAKAEYAAMTFAEFADWQDQHQRASRASKKRRAQPSAAAAPDDSQESSASTGAVEACGPL